MKFNSAYIFIFLFYFFSCRNYTKPVNNKIQAEYVAIEIYCFCVYDFSSKNQAFYNTCSTASFISAHMLVRPERLYYSNADQQIIKKFKNIFFGNTLSKDTLTQPTEARLVILFKKNDSTGDTLIFNTSNYKSFNFNDKYKFNYPYNVMDSIKVILNKRKITCD
jgi:hypothetical protein